MGRFWIGTSGWQYGKGRFYSEELPTGERLSFYVHAWGFAVANATKLTELLGAARPLAAPPDA